MRLQPGFLSRDEVETVHHNALRVLEDVGVKVEHEELRRRLGAVGGKPGPAADVVRFPAQPVERLVAEAPKTPMPDAPAGVGARVGIYHSRYLQPGTDELVGFDEMRLAGYAAMARELDCVEGTGMLGVPFALPDMPRAYQPLAEKLYSWKYGLDADGSVIFTALCEPLLEMFRCHASATGRKLEAVFRACGYLVSPLRLARPECEQFLFFQQQGLPMYLGHLPSQGGTAPVTFAGALVLALAERIFLFLLQRAFREDAPFSVDGTPGTVDMRSGFSCYGRPEMQRFNVAFADLARFYACSCAGHTGLTDAKRPSCEAGAQKAMGALVTALACGHATVSAGLLGMDEICSPVQLVLDSDIVGGLRALLAGANVTEDLCAFDDIRAAGPGGSFLGTDLTVDRFREELWQPGTWSSGSTSAWLLSGGRIDVDRARDVAIQFEKSFEPTSHITPEEEKDLRAIIRHAVRTAAV